MQREKQKETILENRNLNQEIKKSLANRQSLLKNLHDKNIER